MVLHRVKPPLDLVVEQFWWSNRAQASAHREHQLPAGRVQLVIALHDEPIAWAASHCAELHAWTGGVVHGPQSSFFVCGPKPRGAVMGVSFRPGAAEAVLGVSASALTDRHVTIEELWGLRGRQLHERLRAAGTAEAAFALLEAELTTRLRAPLLLHPAVAHALQACSRGLPRVGDIRDETGYSAKHFVALFRAAIGLTPKQYLRIQRFGSVLHERAGERSDRSLAELALEAGYSDQAHLTREFREFAGITPTDYRPPVPASVYHHVVT